MSVRPTEMVSSSTNSSTNPLDLVTRFSTEIGAMTDLGALAERIIQELCRVAGTGHGALYLLDREHEHFRRAGVVGLAAPSCFPATLPLAHPIPQHLSALLPPQTEPMGSNGRHPAADDALRAMRAVASLPHISRSRLIAFSLFGQTLGQGPDAVEVPSLWNALAQTATNALDTSMLLEDLHRSHALMKRTDRLKSLETIAGGFAHEIRNPLTSIKTFIQLAPERKDDPDFIRDFSRIVLDDVYRIERLIEEILDYARYMEPKLTEEDINDIVSSCLYFIEVKADSRGIKIEKELASDLPRVMLDRQQIKQVFLNLFLNALDAMSERGGVLRVRTKALAKPGGRPWVQIETVDTGTGIPEGNLEHIFDPFFTTKHQSGEHEGTGLGLTIVHQIIEEHHGEIRVASVAGNGTTFLINLPAIPS
ncbi:MAG TPA: ATP-binding protein [Nitrospira sp.]|jgi:signal transduction histidine kinase|nr:ATP-binding protein [Nitrospira sp.]